MDDPALGLTRDLQWLTTDQLEDEKRVNYERTGREVRDREDERIKNII